MLKISAKSEQLSPLGLKGLIVNALLPFFLALRARAPRVLIFPLFVKATDPGTLRMKRKLKELFHTMREFTVNLLLTPRVTLAV